MLENSRQCVRLLIRPLVMLGHWFMFAPAMFSRSLLIVAMLGAGVAPLDFDSGCKCATGHSGSSTCPCCKAQAGVSTCCQMKQAKSCCQKSANPTIKTCCCQHGRAPLMPQSSNEQVKLKQLLTLNGHVTIVARIEPALVISRGLPAPLLCTRPSLQTILCHWNV